jgi:hypothetical protein
MPVGNRQRIRDTFFRARCTLNPFCHRQLGAFLRGVAAGSHHAQQIRIVALADDSTGHQPVQSQQNERAGG